MFEQLEENLVGHHTPIVDHLRETREGLVEDSKLRLAEEYLTRCYLHRVRLCVCVWLFRRHNNDKICLEVTKPNPNNRVRWKEGRCLMLPQIVQLLA